MKLKRIAVGAALILGLALLTLPAWSGRQSAAAPAIFSSAGGQFERERVLFNVNARGTNQSIWWVATNTSYEKLVQSVLAECPQSAGWVHHKSAGKFEASMRSRYQVVMVQKRDDGSVQVSLHGEPSKADYWAEWIRTRGQVRVYDPMNIGLFRKPGPLPTAAKVP